jgi:hypothetical protein
MSDDEKLEQLDEEFEGFRLQAAADLEAYREKYARLNAVPGFTDALKQATEALEDVGYQEFAEDEEG